MQSPSAFLLGEHSVILHRNSKPPTLVGCWFSDGIVGAEKEHLYTTGVYFRINLKAVMLAHQYNRVSRIAWLCS